MVNKPFLQSKERICALGDMLQLKNRYPLLQNENRVYVVSSFIRALSIKNVNSKYPIVIYVDIENENIIAIFYEKSKSENCYSYTDLNSIEDTASTDFKTVLETISNRLLPNMSVTATNELLSSIIDFGCGVETYLPYDILDFIRDTVNGKYKEPLLVKYPRINTDVVSQLQNVMRAFGIVDKVPSDILLSSDKTWVFKGTSKELHLNYIELEVRQAQRSVDRGFEFKVIDPGFKRRIIDVSQLKFTA